VCPCWRDLVASPSKNKHRQGEIDDAPLLEKHRATLDGALNAIATRGYWSAYNEMPSPKTYGETAAEDGKKAFEAHLGKQFELEQPGQTGWTGGEQSPYGIELGVRYPVCDHEALIAAGQQAMVGWQRWAPKAAPASAWRSSTASTSRASSWPTR
jgi:hypothetical protein